MIELFANYWWPWWVLCATAIAFFAGLSSRRGPMLGAASVILAYGLMRAVDGHPDHWLAAMLIWLLVSFFMIRVGLPLAGSMAALSSAAYYEAWTSYFWADVFAVAMFIFLGAATVGGTGRGRLARMGQWIARAWAVRGGAIRGDLGRASARSEKR